MWDRLGEELTAIGQSLVLGLLVLLPIGMIVAALTAPPVEDAWPETEDDGEWLAVAPLVASMRPAPVLVPILSSSLVEEPVAAEPTVVAEAPLAIPARTVASVEAAPAAVDVAPAQVRPVARADASPHRPTSVPEAAPSSTRATKKCPPPPENPQITQGRNGATVVDRDLVDHFARRPGELSELGWAAVHEDAAGRADGFRVGGLRCNNVLHQAGFRNGDVVHSVNGHRVTSIPQALRTWVSVRGDDRLVVDVTRKDGTRQAMVFRLR